MAVWDADLFGLVAPCGPLLKWPGGKSRLVDLIESKLSPGARFCEPFLGSAAVFMGMRRTYPSYLLADVNPDSINLFDVIRDEDSLPAFLDAAAVLFTAENNTAEGYGNIRAWFNSRTANRVQQAAGFLWLNKAGFNGLVRYNASGELNVPYGRPDHIAFPRQSVMTFHEKSQRATFRCQCFRETMADLGAGDVAYVDPPYSPLTETSDFSKYTQGGFTAADHADLLVLCRQAAERGALVVVSEHDTPETRARFEGAARVSTLAVRRSMAADGAKRGMAAELLVTFPPAANLAPVASMSR